jgi:hypothetical protein
MDVTTLFRAHLLHSLKCWIGFAVFLSIIPREASREEKRTKHTDNFLVTL